MKNIAEKIMICSIIGMMQLGIGTSIIEASPLHNQSITMQQQDDRYEAKRMENERHERAMERRPNESDREYNDRQNRENEKHARNLARISQAIFR